MKVGEHIHKPHAEGEAKPDVHFIFPARSHTGSSSLQPMPPDVSSSAGPLSCTAGSSETAAGSPTVSLLCLRFPSSPSI